MNRRRWWVWVSLSAIYVLTSWVAVAQPEALVETTARLNLRSCPDSEGCRILTTLAVGTRLEVLARQDEWLRVQVAEQDQLGWVHSGYVQTLVVEAQRESHLLRGVTSDQLAVAVWLVVFGALVLRGLSKLPTRRIAFAAVGFALAGFLLIMMQFGPLVARLAAPLVDLESLRLLWDSTTVPSLGYDSVVLAEVLAVLAMLLFVPGGAVARRGLAQGLAVGFLVVPAFVVVAAAVAAVGWVLFWVVKVALLVIWYVLWPIRWLFENVLAPLLLFLATPLVWVWEEFILPFVLYISPPFVWLWQVILDPVLYFAQRFVVRPILVVVAGVVACTVVLAPFVITGMVAADGVRRGFRGAANTGELFSQGVAFGLLGIDTVVALCLAELGYIEYAASFPIVVLLGVTLLGVLRTTLLNRESSFEVGELEKMASDYFQTSGLGICFACIMLPVAVVAKLSLEDV